MLVFHWKLIFEVWLGYNRNLGICLDWNIRLWCVICVHLYMVTKLKAYIMVYSLFSNIQIRGYHENSERDWNFAIIFGDFPIHGLAKKFKTILWLYVVLLFSDMAHGCCLLKWQISLNRAGHYLYPFVCNKTKCMKYSNWICCCRRMRCWQTFTVSCAWNSSRVYANRSLFFQQWDDIYDKFSYHSLNRDYYFKLPTFSLTSPTLLD